MAEIELSQAEADALLSMEKIRADDKQYDFPTIGLLHIPLVSRDHTERFLLDVRRTRIDISKVTYQNRARHIVVLARLDLNGSPHRNPDGAELPCPHLHLYREGYAAKWAFPVPADFGNPSDLWQTLEDFQRFCNVSDRPKINRGLFA
jgi:hypothetical protein